MREVMAMAMVNNQKEKEKERRNNIQLCFQFDEIL